MPCQEGDERMREETKNTPQLLVFLFPPWKNPIKTSELLGKSARLLKAPEILQAQGFSPQTGGLG